ncbi:MAG: zf-HC2 domain-containing protein [Myxococcales bacterium]|nr:zf-HC2 domain-containing protein [Myxococcales bacterium]
MSLLLRRREIERAVAGELDATAELRLRAHLGGCESCRGHYDALSLAARALRGAAQATEDQSRRELARLEEALAAPPPSPAVAGGSPSWLWLGFRPLPASRGRGSPEAARGAQAISVDGVLDVRRDRNVPSTDARPRRDRPQQAEKGKTRAWARWAAAGLAAAAAGVALFVTFGRPAEDRGAEVGFRGGGKEAADLSVLVHARAADAPGTLRLVAELPGSGEGQLSARDLVQFSYAHQLAPGYLAILGVQAGGEVHWYFPPQVGQGPLPPTREPRPVGSSVSLSERHRLGLVRVFAVLSPQRLDAGRLEAAAREAASDLRGRHRLDTTGQQASGLFLIAR